MHFSRYSLIPLCNLDEDIHLAMIDMIYARNLALNKQVLWYSDTVKPDLGGHEDRDFRIYFQEEIENPEVAVKGFYRGYSVELDLSMLPVNTVLQSEYVKDFEDATAFANQYQDSRKGTSFGQVQATGEFDTDLDEYVTCATMFKHLKTVINIWLQDLSRNDVYADALVSHLFRWLSSPAEAKLYDPLLHRLVHKLMKKNFFMLLQSLKLLGCKVVYASFHKVIIHTERTSLDEADNFIKFVLHTIKQNPLFTYINLVPSEYWSILLFKDAFNYGGVQEQAGSARMVTQKWDVALHLPPAIQKKFGLVVGEYILKVYKHNLKLRAHGVTTLAGEDENQVETARAMNYMDSVDDQKKERDHEFIERLIGEYFSRKLLSMIEDMDVKKDDEVH